MKVLLVAGFFPPYAPMSATRVNKLAKYLFNAGHDVRVLGAKNIHYPPVMALEVPEDRVTFAPVFEVLDVPEKILACIRPAAAAASKAGDGVERAGKPGQGVKQRPGLASRLKSAVMRFYASVVSVPDSRIGWYPSAVREGRRMLADWKPDVIYASAPPHTSLLVASKLAGEFNIPWFCEYRDLWVDHPYYDGSWLRRLIERPLEGRVLANCAGLVTVTRTWAAHLKTRHNKPVAFVMNGFDPDDYAPADSLSPLDSGHLTILYAGGIYVGKRDPAVLFQALADMGAAAHMVRVHFYMPESGLKLVAAMAKDYGVTDQIVLHGLVQRDLVVELQQRSDILLLLRWDSPEENGVLAGKLFEYIGSGRPILSLGSTTGEAAEIIRQNGLGLVTNDKDQIIRQLEEWLAQKRNGKVPPPPEQDLAVFSRPYQFGELVKFIQANLK